MNPPEKTKQRSLFCRSSRRRLHVVFVTLITFTFIAGLVASVPTVWAEGEEVVFLPFLHGGSGGSGNPSSDPEDDAEPEPEPEPTPQPSVEPEPEPEPSGEIEVVWEQPHYRVPPIPVPQVSDGEVPLCPPELHDPTQHHYLYDVENECHYDHEHGDDPNWVNDHLGEPGAWFGRPGKEFSYPWQTPGENQKKHEGYQTFSRIVPDEECPITAPSDQRCVKAVRVVLHGLGDARGAATRFHSYSVELLWRMEGQEYRSHYGGWADTGTLCINNDNQDPENDDGTKYAVDLGDGAELDCSRFPRKLHGWRTDPDGTSNEAGHRNETVATWYTKTPLGQVASHFTTFGGVDPADPYTNQFADPRYTCPEQPCQWNASARQLHQVVLTRNRFMKLRMDETETFYRDAWLDRYGNVVQGCSEIGLDCIPMTFSKMPIMPFPGSSNYQYRDDHVGLGKTKYDVSPAARGTGTEYWITHPN